MDELKEEFVNVRWCRLSVNVKFNIYLSRVFRGKKTYSARFKLFNEFIFDYYLAVGVP